MSVYVTHSEFRRVAPTAEESTDGAQMMVLAGEATSQVTYGPLTARGDVSEVHKKKESTKPRKSLNHSTLNCLL